MSPRQVALAEEMVATHRKKADRDARPIAMETGEARNSAITGGPGIPAAPEPTPARMPSPPHSQRGGLALKRKPETSSVAASRTATPMMRRMVLLVSRSSARVPIGMPASAPMKVGISSFQSTWPRVRR